MTCTFFGHRDTPKEKELPLRKALTYLIENEGVDTFYVGNNGSFDTIARNTLLELTRLYPIQVYIVLSAIPKVSCDYIDLTLIPDGIETVPPRFAIYYRNRWMVNHSDYVVTAVSRPFGGAAKFKEYAKKQNKNIIEL